MDPGKVLIIHQQNSDCSALKSVLSRERFDVFEAALEMNNLPFDIDDCLVLLDKVAAAPDLIGWETPHLTAARHMAVSAIRKAKQSAGHRTNQMSRKNRFSNRTIQLGERTIVLGARVVRTGCGEVRLTRIECGILAQLLAHANRTVPSVDLVRKLWPADITKGVHSLRAFIKNLRKKIEPDAARPQYIVTDLALGYRLRLPAAAPQDESAQG